MKLFAPWALGVWVISSSTLFAQAPPAKDVLPPPQVLPQPKELPPLPMLSIRPIPGPQLGQRNVWELYSVDSRGRFLPRVVYDPHESYYLSDGRPYPWTTLEPRFFMAYPTD
jgi:hypothetical protein